MLGLFLLVYGPESLVNRLMEVSEGKLQVSLTLINNVKAMAKRICSQSLVGLVHLLYQFQCNGVLDVATEVCQEKQALLNHPNVRVLQDA